MANESDSRAVAKLVLLEQACCDSRLKGSHRGVLAVILDACYDKPRSYPGPTRIGKIAGLNEKTVRNCIQDLATAGYFRTEFRTQKTTWYYPNFSHAERSGCLVTEQTDTTPMRVHRPVSAVKKAGPQIPEVGLQVPQCGSTGPSMRVHRPTEAVLEAVPNQLKEAVTPPALSFDDWVEQEQPQQEQKRLAEEQQARERQSVREEYIAIKVTHPVYAKTMERVFGKHLADLIDPAPSHLPRLEA
jgi:hypothetical protein